MYSLHLFYIYNNFKTHSPPLVSQVCSFPTLFAAASRGQLAPSCEPLALNC